MMNLQMNLHAQKCATLMQNFSPLKLSSSQEERLRSSIAGHELLMIFENHALTPLFQPIIEIANRRVFAYEALIRGPKNSFLHNPLNLLQTAEEHGCLFEVDWLARLTSIDSFRRQQASSRQTSVQQVNPVLFLNVSVNTIMQKTHRSGITLEYLHQLGIPVDQVVIEITELQPVEDFRAFVSSVAHYREMGFKVAVDDLGAGYNGLRIWSELRPDFVKIDHHFVSNINNDIDKMHFMETLCNLASQLDTRIIAEGVEGAGELKALENLGVDFVQGFLFQRPQETMSDRIDFDWKLLESDLPMTKKTATAADLLENSFVLECDCTLMEAALFFFANPEADFLPVVIDGCVKGVVWRGKLMTYVARSLDYADTTGDSIYTIMDSDILSIPLDTGLDEVANLLVTDYNWKNNAAFVITENGRYAGCGTMASLLMLLVAGRFSPARRYSVS